MSDISSLINMVNNSGFPIVISIYLLLRFEKRLESLNTTIQNISTKIEKILRLNKKD